MFVKYKKSIVKIAKAILGKKFVVKKQFAYHQKYKLNLSDPQTFSEKIQWLKLYGNLEDFGKYVDKYEVREYVEEKIGSKYLIPLITVYEKGDYIELNTLPKSFMIKATHGSGWNLKIDDKSQITEDQINKIFNSWLNSNYYKMTSESNYKNIKPRVVVEEILGENGGNLEEYKFFCFQGVPQFIQYDEYIHNDRYRDLYDLEWNKLDVIFKYENLKSPVKKPENLDKLTKVAKLLSEDFNFARIDLYSVNDKEIYFGEITLTPGGGYQKFSDIEFDKQLGKLLDLKIPFITKN